MDDLQIIRKKENDIYRLEEILALLGWDQETGMPEQALEDRSDQMAWVQQKLSEQLMDPEWETLIEKIEGEGEQIAWKKNLARRFLLNKALPPDFLSEFVRITSLSREAWLDARKKEDFSIFLPHLQKVVHMARERAEYLGFEEEPYNALLDLYEPGVTASELEGLFIPLEKDLVPLIDEVIERQDSKEPDFGILAREKQKLLHLNLLNQMGYDTRKGRLDFSVHPFTTTLGACDVRITTHLDSNDFFNGLFSTIHEAGHGLYEQNLPSQWKRTVNGQACSLGIHESQSRFWENIIGRSRPFWEYMTKAVLSVFPGEFSSETPESLYRKSNYVKKGFIRIDADEFTYNLHVMLRFDLERKIINGDADVKELPDLWNSKFKELFGVIPHKPSMGVLQDIHWSLGDWGYFPTYTLGNLYAAQIWDTLKRALPDWENHIETGNFKTILSWLVEHIHSKGATHSPGSLITSVSGKALDYRYFINYLKEKAETLYVI